MSLDAPMGSDLKSKMSVVFAFEQEQRGKDFFGGRLGSNGGAMMLLTKSFDSLRQIINEDMLGYNDCG